MLATVTDASETTFAKVSIGEVLFMRYTGPHEM